MANSEKVWAGDKIFNGKRLDKIFEQEIDNDKIAWYVDYFTEDAQQYNVRYLAEDGNERVMMTNENKEQRDPNDLANSQWTGDDVAEWFRSGKTSTHTWAFIFAHGTGEVYGLHVQPYRVFPFGSRALSLPVTNLWDDYTEHGIHGPLTCLSLGQAKLVAIVADPEYATLDGYGLGQDYVLALAAIIDK